MIPVGGIAACTSAGVGKEDEEATTGVDGRTKRTDLVSVRERYTTTKQRMGH